jgi:hypothetical protein
MRATPILGKQEGWIAAINILDRAGDIDAVLAEPTDLFEKFENTQTQVRKRASRRAL